MDRYKSCPNELNEKCGFDARPKTAKTKNLTIKQNYPAQKQLMAETYNSARFMRTFTSKKKY